MLIHKLHSIFRRFMAPTDGGDASTSTGGGAADDRGDDRGDDFLPTGPDADGGAAQVTAPEAGAGKAEAETGLRDAGAAEEPPEEKDDDAEDEAEGDEAKAKGKGKPRIPLDRHEKILAKERERRTELEQQLAQFQRGKEVAQTNTDITTSENKVLELEGKYHAALNEGDTDAAAKLMREIRIEERAIADLKSDMKTAAAEARAVERVRYSVALERVEESFPQLSPDSPDFNEELTQDVVDLKATYERRGLTPTAALQKAVKTLVGAEGGQQKRAVEVTPRVDADAAAKEVAKSRKEAAVAKTAQAVKSQPPSSRNVGLNSDALGGGLNAKDVIRMGHDEFVKLSDSALAKMRGDEL
jgi:myosin heavy subunit